VGGIELGKTPATTLSLVT